MDSGNSGSLQSSSAGDEDYDDSSRTAASANDMFFPAQLPLPSIFDPFSSYPQNQTMNLNPNTHSWTRSEPDSIIHHPLLTSTTGGLIIPSSFNQAAVGSEKSNPIPKATVAVARNPKKRSRASRRAPTTVLTTDTTNFRAMVQEFTGIPAPPFCNPSTSFPRTAARLDHLFSGTRSADPPFLRRPLTQKVQSPVPPFLSAPSSSLLTSTAVANLPTTTNNNRNTAPSSTPQVNLQLPPHQNSNFFNTQIPFHSKSPNIPLVSSFGFPTTDQFDDDCGSLIGFQNLISRDQNAVDWRNNGVVQEENEGFQNSSFAGLISSFHSEKGPENAAGMRGEGTIDSWIFSSDREQDEYDSSRRY